LGERNLTRKDTKVSNVLMIFKLDRWSVLGISFFIALSVFRRFHNNKFLKTCVTLLG
jgi:hypothetical protein